MSVASIIRSRDAVGARRQAVDRRPQRGSEGRSRPASHRSISDARGYHPQLATVASTSDVFDEDSMSIMAASVTSSRTQVMYVAARTRRRPALGEK